MGGRMNDDALKDGFDDSVVVSVPVGSSSKGLYALVTDIKNLSNFYPGLEFRSNTDDPLKAGDIYYVRPRGTGRWIPYRIPALEENTRIAGKLVGEAPIFEAFRFDHEVVTADGRVFSREKVDYKLRHGIIGKIFNALFVKRMLNRQVLNAHLELKKASESRERRLAST